MASWKTAFFPTSRLSLYKKALKDLDRSKSVGVDSISPRVLSLSAPAKAEEVVKLINKFIEKRDWILELKRTNVSPIFKNHNATDKKNYRPVSVLGSMAELYERVIYVQLCGYIRPHFSLNLSGFLKGHSCCSICLLKMTEAWRINLDQWSQLMFPS